MRAEIGGSSAFGQSMPLSLTATKGGASEGRPRTQSPSRLASTSRPPAGERPRARRASRSSGNCEKTA